jgi:N-methylhydantoinase B/oxoprolinase/acetone carboxylase alpha subunit
MTYTALLATAYYVVKSVMDPSILPNAGLARPLRITAPLGSILNCTAPAAVNGRLQTCQRVADMILGALAQVVPERVMACSNSACVVAYFIGKQPTPIRPGSISRRSAAAAARAPPRTGWTASMSTPPTPRTCRSNRWRPSIR